MLCLGVCGVAPECRFEYDYAYAGTAFATLPHSATNSCCAAYKADSWCAIFVLSGCALKAAMTGGNAIPGVVSRGCAKRSWISHCARRRADTKVQVVASI